jgi:hypothetical protein
MKFKTDFRSGVWLVDGNENYGYRRMRHGLVQPFGPAGPIDPRPTAQREGDFLCTPDQAQDLLRGLDIELVETVPAEELKPSPTGASGEGAAFNVDESGQVEDDGDEDDEDESTD